MATALRLIAQCDNSARGPYRANQLSALEIYLLWSRIVWKYILVLISAPTDAALCLIHSECTDLLDSCADWQRYCEDKFVWKHEKVGTHWCAKTCNKCHAARAHGAKARRATRKPSKHAYMPHADMHSEFQDMLHAAVTAFHHSCNA